MTCATCFQRGTGPKGAGQSARMLPAYEDAHGNVRHWAQDRGRFAAAPFGALARLGTMGEAYALAIMLAPLVTTGAAQASDIRRFQQAVGIPADGAWGPQTRAAMVGVLNVTPEGRVLANRLPSSMPSRGGGGGGGGGGAAEELAPPPAGVSLPSWLPWAAGAVAFGAAGGLLYWGLTKKRRRGR